MNRPSLEWTDIDRRIWEEELEPFVPQTIFDVHTHLYLWKNNTDPEKDGTPMGRQVGARFPRSDWAAVEACDAVLLPDRRVHRLSFPYPFPVVRFPVVESICATANCERLHLGGPDARSSVNERG